MSKVKTVLVRLGISGTWSDLRFNFVQWVFKKWKWIRSA